MRKLFLKYAMLSLVLLFVGCSEDAEYVKVIPSDASLVMAVDCDRIMEESGLFSDHASDSQKEFLETSLDKLSVGKEELMRRILQNPNESGIDWSKNVYYFEVPDTKTRACVFSVVDEQKAKTFIEVFGDSSLRGGKFSDENGFAWARLNSSYMAINEKALVVVTSLGAEKRESIKDRVAAWLNQSEEQSFISNKYYKMLQDIKGEIAGVIAFTGIPEDISMIANLAYAEQADFSTIKYLFGVSFEEGQLKSDGKLIYEDEKMLQWLKNQEKVCKKLNGESLKHYPLNTSAWLSVGLDGNKLYDHLLDHPVYGKELKNMSLPFNLEGVIRSIDGDIAFGYPTGVRMDVKNKELLKILVGTAKTMGSLLGVEMEEISPDQYKLYGSTISRFRPEGRRLQPRVGMINDTFYLLSDSLAVKPLRKEESLASAPWAENVEDNILFAAFNFNKGSNLLGAYSHSARKTRMLKQYFDYITLSQKSIEANQIVVSLADKETNVLQQFIQMYLQYNR